MNHDSGIFSIVIGCILIILALSIKQFHWTTGYLRASGRPMPTWLGRIFF